MAKIHKSDTVQIMIGKDHGKRGKVITVDAKASSVMVEGLNMYKKNKKPTRQGEKGEIITVSRMIPMANVRFLCGSCNRPVRIGFRFEGTTKVRFCKKCNIAA